MFDPSEQKPYPAAGEIIDGKYKIEKLLGEGGMGAVARATHVVLGGTLAVKFMNPQFMSFPGAVERFVNEGRASKAIKSDHVLPVNEIGLLPNGAPYLLMECLYGLDLADLLARDGPSGLPIPRAIHFIVQILRGLQAAHAIGIIHRDMKPANCFVVTHDGEEDWVKILDFGISKIQQPGQSSLTQTNSALGTPLYMSPEQARSPRDVDHRSDIYSVGVILYELLSGRTPFFSESGEFTEILFQLFTAEPPPIKEARPDIPDQLAAVVHKALAREVADRYSTATELAEALLPFCGPKTAAMVERMQNYKAPTKDSVVPGANGLPTSMDALSQLRHGGGHGTEHMAHRPTTDIQKGAPVTAMIADVGSGPSVAGPVTPVPGAVATQKKTAFLQQEAKPAVQTHDGATVDRTSIVVPKQSPLIYAMPAAAALILGGGITIFAMRGHNTNGNTVPSAGPPSAVVSIPSSPSSPTTTASTPPATSAVADVGSAASATPPAVVSGRPAVPGVSSATSTVDPSAKPNNVGRPNHGIDTPKGVVDVGLH